MHPSEPVTRRYQAVIGENQHRAGTLHLAVDILNALREILPLRDEKSYKFGLIGGAAAEFGKMHVAVQKLTLKFVDIADFRNGHNRETPQMAVDYDRLGIGVTDYAYAGATGELIQVSLELGAEIRALQIMDRAAELISLRIVRGHTASARTQVRMIVGTIKQVCHATILRGHSKKTSHK